jgi:hydrogenase maturation factor
VRDRVSDEFCITCGDVALPVRVVSLDVEPGLAVCADGFGGEQAVEVALVAPVELGEELLVHAGTAIARVGEQR